MLANQKMLKVMMQTTRPVSATIKHRNLTAWTLTTGEYAPEDGGPGATMVSSGHAPSPMDLYD
eukprot:scaffold2850_cov175-Amphora_coffeaeformis.AAC.3